MKIWSCYCPLMNIVKYPQNLKKRFLFEPLKDSITSTLTQEVWPASSQVRRLEKPVWIFSGKRTDTFSTVQKSFRTVSMGPGIKVKIIMVFLDKLLEKKESKKQPEATSKDVISMRMVTADAAAKLFRSAGLMCQRMQRKHYTGKKLVNMNRRRENNGNSGSFYPGAGL